MEYGYIHLIINPAAGQRAPILHTINNVLYEADVDWQVSVTNARRTGADLARAAIDDGADLIMVYGGDGTVTSVINGMVGRDVPLALLHGGTGNALAHSLGIPTDLTAAVELLRKPHQRRALDLGRVTQDDDPEKPGYFVLRSSIGLQNRLLEEATPELKERFGNLAYLAAGLRSLTASETANFQLEVDDQSVEVEGLTCIVANSAAVGGQASFSLAPGVEPDDGALDVFVLSSGLDSLAALMNTAMGADLDEVANHWRGQEIAITMSEPTTVTLDGEPFGETPVTIVVVPRALQILVPA